MAEIEKFQGWFFKAFDDKTGTYGDDEHAFPIKYMYKESYVGAREVQDLNSSRNANGVLVRNPLDHVAHTIDFTTPPMWNDDMEKMFDFFNKHYLEGYQTERKLRLMYYENESNTYLQGEFYLATPKFSILRVEGTRILYASMQISLVEY